MASTRLHLRAPAANERLTWRSFAYSLSVNRQTNTRPLTKNDQFLELFDRAYLQTTPAAKLNPGT